MKKLMFLAAIMMVAIIGKSQNAQVKEQLAVFEWASTNFDFGKIKQGVPVTHEFKFTNKGKAPLIITNVQASCGCTSPGWTREAVPPGGEGYVKATFNAANAGVFNKTVTVTANIESGFVTLSFKGEVEAAAVKQPNK
jgi:hypothetical protein